jgi:hypothetical protein
MNGAHIAAAAHGPGGRTASCARPPRRRTAGHPRACNAAGAASAGYLPVRAITQAVVLAWARPAGHARASATGQACAAASCAGAPRRRTAGQPRRAAAATGRPPPAAHCEHRNIRGEAERLLSRPTHPRRHHDYPQPTSRERSEPAHISPCLRAPRAALPSRQGVRAPRTPQATTRAAGALPPRWGGRQVCRDAAEVAAPEHPFGPLRGSRSRVFRASLCVRSSRTFR